jgi:hypothetical protein
MLLYFSRPLCIAINSDPHTAMMARAHSIDILEPVRHMRSIRGTYSTFWAVQIERTKFFAYEATREAELLS